MRVTLAYRRPVAQPNCGGACADTTTAMGGRNTAAVKVKTRCHIKNFGMAKLFGLFYKQIGSESICFKDVIYGT